MTDEVVICGFTDPKGSRAKFGALIIGQYVNNELQFCGHVGTGFKENDLEDLYNDMLPLIISDCPFPKAPKTNDKPTWIKPELIAEIKYTELTKDHIYRHPVFLHLRVDKSIKDLKHSEQVDQHSDEVDMTATEPRKPRVNSVVKKVRIHNLKLTNQDKIYFPELEISKKMVIDYYQSIATYILPHLKNRPQSLNRFPNGIQGMSFYQKDAADSFPDWMPSVEIFSESTEKYIDYVLCNSKADLAYLNNLGCIDLNPWSSAVDNLDNPSYLVLDLDPSEIGRAHV